jgi:uncharacterized protein (DUF488 family)
VTRIYTLGHSTRTLADFLELLARYEIELLVDVRTVPRSRRVPHFNSDVLQESLRARGIEYDHQKQLGGLRKADRDSVNLGWRNAGFRGFADHMQSQEFWPALQRLTGLAQRKRATVMCAEAVPWRCHRSLIADALVIGGMKVRHILSTTDARIHEVTPFAQVREGRITYPVAKSPDLFQRRS